MKMKKWLFLTILAVSFCGSANAMTERIWWNGSAWTPANHVATVNYKAMARDYRAFNPVLAAFGAREDGSALVNIVSDNGGVSWHEMLVSYNNYKAITGAPFRSAADPNLYTCVFAIRADSNDVQWVRYVGATQTWLVTDVNVVGVGVIDQYKALAFDSASNVGGGSYTFYGARTDGAGVDQIYSSDFGSTWNKNSLVSTTNYKALCSMMHNGFAGAKADGTGLWREWNASGWNTQQISTQDFSALTEEIVNTGPAYSLFGARADGSGLKRVLTADNGTTWNTYDIWPEHYKSLAPLGHLTANMVIGSYNCTQSLYDLDNNCKVDFADFAAFAAEWLDCGKELPGSCN
jgi:hypothetical protein